MRIMESEESITRESILKLMENKDQIEFQLRELKQILDANGIGMKESLVDREGYPRQDIDVYQVRQARHKIICLQNDHKLIMGQIEKGLHYLHLQSSNKTENIADSNLPVSETKPVAFAKIVHIDKNSPADLAGLQTGDLVVSFGSVNYENFKSMQDVSSVVRHSVGRNVAVVVQRGRQTKTLTLVPKEWNGKGLLGCVIIGLDNVER